MEKVYFGMINFLQTVIFNIIFHVFSLSGLSNLTCDPIVAYHHLHTSITTLITHLYNCLTSSLDCEILGDRDTADNSCISSSQLEMTVTYMILSKQWLKDNISELTPKVFPPGKVLNGVAQQLSPTPHCWATTKAFTVRPASRIWLFCFKAFFKCPTQTIGLRKKIPQREHMESSCKQDPEQPLWRLIVIESNNSRGLLVRDLQHLQIRREKHHIDTHLH